MIENKIKENDKAFIYSYKLKDSENAKMYIRFEKFVNSEVINLNIYFNILIKLYY